MKKNILRAIAFTLSAFIILLSAQAVIAQGPPAGGRPQGGNFQQMNIGRFYGRVVDEKGTGVGFAAVQLYGMRFDTISKSMKEALITGQITEDNGDFALENLPIVGDFTLKISFLGYGEVAKPVTFGVKAGQRPNMSGGASKFDVDLGNISLAEAAQTLDEVVVKGEASTVTMALDRKVFKMDKNSVASGGTAVDALKNVPSLSVDLDGNITMRNASPQVFIDGRPTNLTLDQVAADAIESVEVITNPSAKYDASGGQGGIVNIVLKKDRRIGYNGMVRVGADSRQGANAGADINAREGKINAFLSGNYNLRQGIAYGETERTNLQSDPTIKVLQTTDGQNKGSFLNGRAGLDWFINNRNTITFAGSLTRGNFSPVDILDIQTDSLLSGRTASSLSTRTSENDRMFRNMGASILYKKLFPQQGREWTADFNVNQVRFDGGATFNTVFQQTGATTYERQDGTGSSRIYTFQTDYVHPLGEKYQLEFGARAAVRDQANNNANFVQDAAGNWVELSRFASQYQYTDQIYAGYATLSRGYKHWGYQVGLRAESSKYEGNLVGENKTFGNQYPISLFPSAFVTYNLNEEDNIQLSYSRRINRPNFFQLIPFTDYSDSLNLRTGNPALLPEFTNSLELTYQNIFKGGNLLISVYYKQASDLITAYQYSAFDELLGRTAIYSGFANSNLSEAYGTEFTLKNSLSKGKLEFTHNINLYNSRVDASNVEQSLVNEQFTWFAKENIAIRLPANFSLQLSGEYRSRAAFSPASGDSGRGRGFHGGPSNSAQGYTIPVWFADVAVRKDLFDRKASLTLNVSDVFRSRRMGSYSATDFFVQESWRVRDPQTFRLNFSYRFGKTDASMFKRKNTNMNNAGNDMM